MSDGGERDSLAPVIPLFGDRSTAAEGIEPAQIHPGVASHHAEPTPSWNATWAEERERDDDGGERDTDDAAERDAAESTLLRRLRTRSLSIREARGVLRERELLEGDADDIIDAFVRLGYLDDAALAEQLVHAAVDRKGQGRQVISQTLAKRGVPRDIADAAIDELPDDDADRALEFARTKARSLSSLDHDTALRRLMGQLSRRGYPGSVAMNAAKLALSEAGSTRSGVRFR